MRVDWCVSSWFRIKNTHSLTPSLLMSFGFDTKEIHTAQQVMQVLLRFCSNTTLTFFLRAMPPSVTLPAAERHDELIDTALYKLVGGARVGAAGTCWERARKQARLPVKMGGMGLTSAVDIREPAWIGTWALVAGPMRHLHAPFRDLDVSKAPGSDFDELRAAHDRLKKEHGEIAATWKEWDGKTKAEYFDLVGGTTGRPPEVEVEPWDEPDEGEKLRASARPPEPATRVALSRFRPHTLVEAKELLPLAEFTSKHEFLHQAQRRFTTVVHNRNWRDLALELRQEGSAGSRSAPRGKKGKAQAKGRERAKHAAWREAVRFVAVSQDGAGAFLNAIPMRDDMRMETWAMRLSVQRRLGLPLDVACQAAAAGKKTRNGKTHDELGDAAVNVPQQGHNTRHKYTLRRLILALRAAWGTAVRMEPKAHLGQSYNKQPDVDADNIGKHGTHYCGDVKVVCPLSSSGEHGRKGCLLYTSPSPRDRSLSRMPSSA